MSTLFWLAVLIVTPIALAYRRTGLAPATGVFLVRLIAYTWQPKKPSLNLVNEDAALLPVLI